MDLWRNFDLAPVAKLRDDRRSAGRIAERTSRRSGRRRLLFVGFLTLP
jgi:hypothetical protein